MNDAFGELDEHDNVQIGVCLWCTNVTPPLVLWSKESAMKFDIWFRIGLILLQVIKQKVWDLYSPQAFISANIEISSK